MGTNFSFIMFLIPFGGLKKIKTIDEGVSPHNNSGHAKNTKLISLVADLHKGVLPPIPSSLASAAKPKPLFYFPPVGPLGDRSWKVSQSQRIREFS